MSVDPSVPTMPVSADVFHLHPEGVPYGLPYHTWRLDPKGRADAFAYESLPPEDHHNGPRCEICLQAFCEHCDPDCYLSLCEWPL